MRNTFLSLNVHVVFSTKNRAPLLTAEIWPELSKYVSGVALHRGVEVLAVGGIEDHVHAFLRLPATISVAETVKRIKGSASRWINRRFAGMRDFAWQEGYAAITVSPSMISKTRNYIENQPHHHHGLSYEDEMKILLKHIG